MSQHHDPGYGQHGYQPLYYVAQPMQVQGWRCLFCGYTGAPSRSSEVTGAGWAVFVLLLVFTCVLAPLGFLFRRDYLWCPRCLSRGV